MYYTVFLFTAVVWQQMRAYTLALLSKLTQDGKTMEDKDIVEWVNDKVRFLSVALCILSAHHFLRD